MKSRPARLVLANDRGFAGPMRMLSVATSLLLASTASLAQYKVIGPDGKVTYTDRAPGPSDGKVSALGARGEAAPAELPLPLELRQPVARYPVTLYVTTDACAPCNTARQLLRQRGVPYTEKQVTTAEDGEALQRITGGRDAPSLMIGAQTLRGLSAELWASYLDSAGYPGTSKLPPNYRYAAATPLVARRETVAPPRPAAPAQTAATAEPETSATGTIKF